MITLTVTREEHRLLLHALLMTSCRYVQMEGSKELKQGAEQMWKELNALHTRLEQLTTS